MMKIEVKNKEYIKPYSKTHESLRKYKLSLPDQLALNFKVPFVFFYDSPSRAHRCHHLSDDNDELKKSLSRTLSLMYPLAGRLREDNVTIDCNDEGVEFIEADVARDMCDLLHNPEIDILRELTPSNPCTGAYEPSPVGKPLIVIQVNRFRCGGMAIGLIFSHGIADVVSATAFFNTWATIHRGSAVDGGDGLVFNCSRIFPPLSNTSTLEMLCKGATETPERKDKYDVRRLVFSRSALSQLKAQAKIESGPQRLSCTEVLMAFVWAAVIRATHVLHPGSRKIVHEISSIVNLRPRMVPPLPPNCIGNLVTATNARFEGMAGGVITNNKWPTLVSRISESLRAVNDGLARKKFGEDGYVRAMFLGGGSGGDKSRDNATNNEEHSYTLQTSSLCGVPLYGADFGWGKPRWVVDVTLLRDFVVFMDTKDGGVEVWMGLRKELMNLLLQDQHFVGYVSRFPLSKM